MVDWVEFGDAMGTSRSTPHLRLVPAAVVVYTKGIAPTTWAWLSPLAVSLQVQESSTRPARKINTAWTYRSHRNAPPISPPGEDEKWLAEAEGTTTTQ